jgi:hypothetical protein
MDVDRRILQMSRLTNGSAIAAIANVLAGVIAAAAAVGWNAVTWTIPESGWRDLETPFRGAQRHCRLSERG